MRYLRWLPCLPVLLLSGVACLVPRPVAHWFGRRVGGLTYFLLRHERRRAQQNIRSRLGLEGSRMRRVAMASFRQAGATFLDLARAPCLTRRAARRAVEVPEETQKLLDEIGSASGGAIIAGGHYGNWELLSLVLPYLLKPLTVVVRDQKGIVGMLMDKARARTGNQICHQRGFVRKGLKTLRSDGIVGILIDQRVGAQAGGYDIEFLGTPSKTSLASGYLAAHTHAPIYMTALQPVGGSRYRLVMRGPFRAPAELDKREASIELMREVTAALSAQIVAYPEHWAWWVRRWKRPRPLAAAPSPTTPTQGHTVIPS